jgi:hypothetical protein
MKYALLINAPEATAGQALSSNPYRGLLARMRAEGSFRGARRFAPAATMVRTRDAGPEVSERGAAPGGETLAAFVIVECEAEEGATALAEEVAIATGAAVEVRPVAAQGEGGPEKAGVAERAPAPGLSEYAFVINVAEEKRPWPGNPAFDELMENCGKVLAKLEAAARFRGTERLAPASKAKTVRVADGRRSVTDGPFSEARELIGGFILGECKGRDEAVALAGLIPGSMSGSVEVREVVE